MIDTIEQTTCKACGKPLTQKSGKGHRARVFCNKACKQADYRRRHPIIRNVTIENNRNVPLEREDQAQRIAELEQELSEANALLEKKQSKQPMKRSYRDRLSRWGEQLGWPALDVRYTIKPGRKNWRVFMMDESNTLLIYAIIAAERAAESKQS